LPLFTGSLAQDITGGSSAELASAADVESRSGRGVFTAPKTVSHHAKRPEKKTVARTTKVSKPQRETASTTRTDRTRTEGTRTTGGGSTTTGTGDPGLESTKPLGDAARRVGGPDELNKQGDDLFDAGQYEKAIDLYKRALRQRRTSRGASEPKRSVFQPRSYDEAIAAANQAIQQRPDWADAYVALGNAYLKLDRDAEDRPLRKAARTRTAEFSCTGFVEPHLLRPGRRGIQREQIRRSDRGVQTSAYRQT